MRGLIKGDEEIPETAWSGFIMSHLELMHTQELASDSVTPSSGEALRTGGNGYALAEDYAEGYEWIITVRDGLLYASRGSPKTEQSEAASDTVSAGVSEQSGEDSTTVTIDGKTYTITRS